MESKLYPEDAVRGALLNAVVHRDYSIGGSVLVSMFGDRMEIVSSGGLPKGVGYDDLLLGVSVPRNPGLAGVFYRLKLTEAYGTGIAKIMDAYRDSPILPKIEVSTNAFKITLPALAVLPVGLNSQEQRVARMLNDSGLVTRTDVEERLGVSKSSAFLLLSDMVAKGMIEAVGRGRGTAYRLSGMRF